MNPRDGDYDFSALQEPLRSELRFAVQQRLDDNRHALDYRRVIAAAAFVQELGVASLLERDHDWWDARLQGRGPRARSVRLGVIEVAFLRFARVRLARLRDRAYGVDPFTGDVWLIEQLGFPEFAYQAEKTISFAEVNPVWLRELIKRWARWRLRTGTYTPGTLSGMATNLKAFSDFLAARGEPLSAPGHLTRELLEDYRAHIGGLGHSLSRRCPTATADCRCSKSCPHPNACLTCDHFLTTEQFLPTTSSSSPRPRS